MNRSTFRKQIEESGRTTREALAANPKDERALFFAALFTGMGGKDPVLDDAALALREWRRRLGEHESRKRLRKVGCVGFLETTWQGLGESHYEGPELLVLADWLIELTETADEIAELPYGFVNWVAGDWSRVGKQATAASEKLASAALARDPENDAALRLYAQPDFLRRVNQSRLKDAPLKGPPVRAKTEAASIAKIERIAKLYREDKVHPLDIPSLETIPVTSTAIIEALLAGLHQVPPGAGKHAFIDALAHTQVDHERVVGLLVAEMANGDARIADEVAMALHYELSEHASAALDPFTRLSRQMIEALSEKNEMDYRHRWPLTTVLTLAQTSTGDDRGRACEFIQRLLAEIDRMPAWKKERLAEFRNEAPAVLETLDGG